MTAKRRQKGNKQDSLTGGNDLQRQHDGKERMAAAGTESLANIVWAVSDDVSTEPENKGRGQTAGSGLAGGKERRLTVGCGDDDVTQGRHQSLCVCGSFK